MEENLIHLDIASEFGAQPKGRRFANYVPNKNQHGKPVAQDQWIGEGELRDFIHRMGAETDQGQMAFEFDGEFYLIDLTVSPFLTPT